MGGQSCSLRRRGRRIRLTPWKLERKAEIMRRAWSSATHRPALSIGKDSSVMLHMAIKGLPSPPARSARRQHVEVRDMIV